MIDRFVLAALLACAAVPACADGPRVRAALPQAPLAGGPPRDAIATAAEAARVEPQAEGFQGAIQRYAWSDGALFQVYAAPGQVTDIALEPGEQLAGAGPVAAGDTARWIIGQSESGAGATRRAHILLKPTQTGLITNLVINTDRRTYRLDLRATSRTFMAAVEWRYPEDALIALRTAPRPAPAAIPIPDTPDPTRLRFTYRIDGPKVAWRPRLAFDDGRQVYVALPSLAAGVEIPPLFVRGPDGGGQLVNYRLQNGYLIVDQLFDIGELRLGAKRSAKIVRIVRTNAEAKR
ncbi:MAG: P-type conjugative transfer protein TrbG [Caulobacter sp.]|nr:P-type conjugative transfer protein TrbG [Caulobacter sp.]